MPAGLGVYFASVKQFIVAALLLRQAPLRGAPGGPRRDACRLPKIGSQHAPAGPGCARPAPPPCLP